MVDWKWLNYCAAKSEPSFRYQLLSRMKQDCEYYLGYGGRNAKQLWACNEQDQIDSMKILWNSFPDEDKPEWLTWEDILNYAEKMGVEQ